jgi:N-acetyl-anhydromuramyl-L-alanine amidase AmpD
VSRARRLAGAVVCLALVAPSGASASARQPAIHQDPIPFPAKRKREMRSYAIRHYGIHSYSLVRPRVIVEHLTAGDTWQSAWSTFAPDVADSELHELPGICSHFVIDQRGVIHKLVSLRVMCRHTVGLNWTSIGIEHVGHTDAQVLGNPRQMSASLRLTRWLQRHYEIATKNVIGHNESLSSPYHRERVARLRKQTHGDWRRTSMERYRKRLKAVGTVATAGGP